MYMLSFAGVMDVILFTLSMFMLSASILVCAYTEYEWYRSIKRWRKQSRTDGVRNDFIYLLYRCGCDRYMDEGVRREVFLRSGYARLRHQHYHTSSNSNSKKKSSVCKRR